MTNISFSSLKNHFLVNAENAKSLKLRIFYSLVINNFSLLNSFICVSRCSLQMPVEYQTLHKCITIDLSLCHTTINRSDQCNVKFFNMKQKRSQAPHAYCSLKIKTTRTNARKGEEESVCSVSSLE